MRFGLVILFLAAIATGLVQLRRSQLRAQRDIQRFQLRELSLQRRLWDQEVRIGELIIPERIRFRARHMPLDIEPRGGADDDSGGRP